MRLLARAKPGDKLSLITDAMSAAGLQDGLYELGGQSVTMKDGICRLTEAGNLAGSTLTMEPRSAYSRKQRLVVPQVSRLLSPIPPDCWGWRM